MRTRDMILLVIGFLIVAGGFLSIFTWPAISQLALLLLNFLLLVLLVLQRRQFAKVNERTLALLRASSATNEALVKSQQNASASTKKILNVLNAQQISMEILNSKIASTEGHQDPDAV